MGGVLRLGDSLPRMLRDRDDVRGLPLRDVVRDARRPASGGREGGCGAVDSGAGSARGRRRRSGGGTAGAGVRSLPGGDRGGAGGAGASRLPPRVPPGVRRSVAGGAPGMPPLPGRSLPSAAASSRCHASAGSSGVATRRREFWLFFSSHFKN